MKTSSDNYQDCVVASTRTYKYEYKYEYLGCKYKYKYKYCEIVRVLLDYKYKYQVQHHCQDHLFGGTLSPSRFAERNCTYV